MSENIKLPTIDRLERGEAETPLITQSFLVDFQLFGQKNSADVFFSLALKWFREFHKTLEGDNLLPGNYSYELVF